MIKTVARTLLAVVVAMALAFALVVALEWFSAIVHPIPEDFTGTIADHVRRYPHWVLGVVVLAWGGTAFAATWVGSRVGNRIAGGIVALLLASALVFNLAMLPYPTWFEIGMPCAVLIACILGIRSGQRPPSAAAVPDSPSL